jgi:hypothetical protein
MLYYESQIMMLTIIDYTSLLSLVLRNSAENSAVVISSRPFLLTCPLGRRPSVFFELRPPFHDFVIVVPGHQNGAFVSGK